MKIKYEFVTKETKEIEVDERLYNESKEIDRLIYNSDQRETRRHQSLDVLTFYDLEPVDESVNIEATCLFNADRQKLKKALQLLNADQKDLVRRVFFVGQSLTFIANEQGVSVQAIHNRLNKILERLRKSFDLGG